MLEVRELRAGYEGSEVLHGIDLSVAEGEVVVILGPNGHGKTTLLRAISGLVRPTAGWVGLDGEELTHRTAEDIAAAGVIHIPQGDLLFPEMTVMENLLMGGYVPHAWRHREGRLAEVLGLFPWLHERRYQLARTLSGGERRMVALGRGLMATSRVLLIDEPSLGLAPTIIEQIYGSIRSIRESGRAILLVEENADHVEGLADRVYLLESGLLVREGPADELLRDDALLATYLS